MNQNKKVAVILVCYNSEKFLHKAIQAVKAQSYPVHQIILIDTGSDNRSYLEPYRNQPGFILEFIEKEAGFCRGNNVGYSHVDHDADYILLLNPDAFLRENYIEKAVAFMEQHSRAGAVTGMALGYDIDKKSPTGLYDSTGIFTSWYGRWFDRAHGIEVKTHLYSNKERVPAICGALFFIRKTVLDGVLIENRNIFDRSFYMYKEDIDLSLRIRKAGWELWYDPELLAYHCRGWGGDRSKIARKMRLCSARNDLRVNLRAAHPIGIIYSMCKYLAVRFLDV